jgi:hypothetical protein
MMEYMQPRPTPLDAAAASEAAAASNEASA